MEQTDTAVDVWQGGCDVFLTSSPDPESEGNKKPRTRRGSWGAARYSTQTGLLRHVASTLGRSGL